MTWIAAASFVLGLAVGYSDAGYVQADPSLAYAVTVVGVSGLVLVLRRVEDHWEKFIQFTALAGVALLTLSLLLVSVFPGENGVLSWLTPLVCGVLLYYFTGREASAAGKDEPAEDHTGTD